MKSIQALVDAMSDQWRHERTQSQMTLGQMIEQLSSLDPNTQVTNLQDPHSYRGYYEDLAFEMHRGTRSVKDLIEHCESMVGAVLEGYKGGDFMMGEDTPVWISNYGNTGDKILSINEMGEFETEPNDNTKF